MDNQPRQSLRDLVAKHGKNVCDDPRRCEALLRDACGAHKRELNILMNALRERVPSDLQTGDPRLPQDILLSRLTTRLTDLGLAEDAARWSVDSWALALGVIAKPRPDAPASSQGPVGTASGTSTPKPKPPTPVVVPKRSSSGSASPSGSASSSRSASPNTGTVASRSTQSSSTASSGPTRTSASPPQASDTTKSGSSGSGGAVQGLWEFGGFLLSIPILFGSAIVVGGAMFWILSLMGYQYKQLSGTAQGVLGVLGIGLIFVVMGAIYALFETVKDLFKQSPK